MPRHLHAPLVALFVVALAQSACSPVAPPAPLDAQCTHDATPTPDAPSPDGPTPRAPYRTRIDSADAYATLASPAREVKFLVRATPDGALPGPLAPHDCAFSNTATYPLHLQFLRSLAGLESYSPAQYEGDTARRASRRYAPGSLYWFPGATHPDGSSGVLAYTLSVANAEAPDTVTAWAAYDRLLAGCVSWPARDLVLVGIDPEQEGYLLAHRAELAALGVTVAPRATLESAPLEVYSPGETYGYLHTLAPGATLDNANPRDLVVADAVSDQLSTPAGLISTFAQSYGSHFNLRMREKRLPNLRWARARESSQLASLEGALVHLRADPSGEIQLERATLEAATCFWRAQQPPLATPEADLATTELRPFAQLDHTMARTYGAKAANLGELYDALPADNRADGFAIPFALYATHMQRGGLAAQRDALLADPAVRTDRGARSARLEELRRAILRTPLAAGVLDTLAQRIRDTFGPGGETLYLRFRSSTNAEDLEQLSGAGLYDSRTGCLADDLDDDDRGPSRCLTPAHRAALEARLADYRAQLAAHADRTYLAPLIEDLEDDLANEKTVADALRKVWRSLWNLRAFDEREYYGLDHRGVYMGVAVMPTVVLERRESVAFTNLDGALYRVISQLGEIGVVRPDIPTAVPEELTFVREGNEATRYTLLRRSTESPERDLYSPDERAQLASLLFRLHDHFATRVYPHRTPLRLDVELDVTATGALRFKQVRPYLGG